MNALLALILALAPLQGSADVAGRVTAKGGKPLANAVIWLTGGGAKAGIARTATVDQRNKTFEPHVVVVQRGARIAFPNSDTVLHNVYAQFEAKRFDLGLYPRGQTKYQAFDKAGVVSVRCNIHSQMSAYIVVVDTPYFAVTDGQGRFKISDVPPGVYKLRLWHESGARDERTVTTSSSGATLDIGLK